jgi:hypothetical protein
MLWPLDDKYKLFPGLNRRCACAVEGRYKRKKQSYGSAFVIVQILNTRTRAYNFTIGYTSVEFAPEMRTV